MVKQTKLAKTTKIRTIHDVRGRPSCTSGCCWYDKKTGGRESVAEYGSDNGEDDSDWTRCLDNSCMLQDAVEENGGRSNEDGKSRKKEC